MNDHVDTVGASTGHTPRIAMAPHPENADDLVWWVLFQGDVFSDDPFEDVVEATIALERRVGTYDRNDPRGRASWSLVRASQAWGYANFKGT
jgi:hypothetical protein